jgi:hypothetical protein
MIQIIKADPNRCRVSVEKFQALQKSGIASRCSPKDAVEPRGGCWIVSRQPNRHPATGVAPE